MAMTTTPATAVLAEKIVRAIYTDEGNHGGWKKQDSKWYPNPKMEKCFAA
jgi:hypothetical protein